MSTAEQARRHRSALLETTERLIAEQDGLVPAGRVLSVVAVCRSELYRTGLRGDALVAATEAMVRVRLQAFDDRRRVAS